MYNDPNHPGNSARCHTGKLCIEGCGRPAGTAWSPYWCFECNVRRIDRINTSLEGLTKSRDCHRDKAEKEECKWN